MPKKVDPLNKKQYGAASAMLTVADVPAALNFYQKAFGFTKGTVMKGPDGKPVHAELRLRDTVLMLGPENLARNARSAKSLGGSPITIYLMADSADKVVAKAVKLGATALGPVEDMFWGDRCGTLTDPDGYTWMVATHIADLTPQEMAKRTKAMASGETASASGGGA